MAAPGPTSRRHRRGPAAKCAPFLCPAPSPSGAHHPLEGRHRAQNNHRECRDPCVRRCVKQPARSAHAGQDKDVARTCRAVPARTPHTCIQAAALLPARSGVHLPCHGARMHTGLRARGGRLGVSAARHSAATGPASVPVDLGTAGDSLSIRSDFSCVLPPSCALPLSKELQNSALTALPIRRSHIARTLQQSSCPRPLPLPAGCWLSRHPEWRHGPSVTPDSDAARVASSAFGVAQAVASKWSARWSDVGSPLACFRLAVSGRHRCLPRGCNLCS